MFHFSRNYLKDLHKKNNKIDRFIIFYRKQPLITCSFIREIKLEPIDSFVNAY